MTAALVGVGIMLVVALLVRRPAARAGPGRDGSCAGSARKLRFDHDTAAAALRQIGERLEELIADRAAARGSCCGPALNWLLDAASLWVFLRAFGGTLDIDALLVAFGLANIVAVIPITPGGLGIVEGIYIPTLVGFGLTRRAATLGVASYRLAQYWFPILLGGVLYAIAARRAVVDRAARPPRPAARHRPTGDRRERAADRVRDAPVGAQAAWSAPDDATIANPLRRPIDAGALDALDPPSPRSPTTATPRPTTATDGRPSGGPDAVASAPMTAHERPFGRYLEDFVVGDVYRHWPGKTITEYDDHLFCMITMNHHPLHTNDWFAEQSVQGRNVVVGNLVYSLVLGMSVPDVSGAAIANLEVETLQHKFPTFHGDTIHAETRVLDVKESSSKPDRGIVTVETKGFNQDGEEVCYFRRRVMVWKRDVRPDPHPPLRRTTAWD